ncbi:hypothetical protein [Methanoculleus chikugoensis]|uniref:hypothetical protein n=1 Tax=Methanoculleus chikugoensis TaxID=118126 RepID=UPI001FB4960F|nr:hypothetical protein [Methanoculleus chikugoensis]
MELILAVDLAGGLVVHGKSGDRAGYRPLTWGGLPLRPNRKPTYPRSRPVSLHRRPRASPGQGAAGRPRPALCRHGRAVLPRPGGFRSPAECAAVPGVTPVVGTETAATAIEDLAATRADTSASTSKAAGCSPGGASPPDGDAGPGIGVLV